MVLSQRLHEAFKGTVEKITGPRTVSAFKEKGVLSVSEFVTAGDNLVSKCPTWSWYSSPSIFLISFPIFFPIELCIIPSFELKNKHFC